MLYRLPKSTLNALDAFAGGFTNYFSYNINKIVSVSNSEIVTSGTSVVKLIDHSGVEKIATQMMIFNIHLEKLLKLETMLQQLESYGLLT